MRFRRFRFFLLFAVCVCASIPFIVSYYSGSNYREQSPIDDSARNENPRTQIEIDLQLKDEGQKTPTIGCQASTPAVTSINTVDQFSQFDFQPAWMGKREFFNESFERRYLKTRAQWKDLPLKVIIVPHSHTDPGWLKTFDEYYSSQVSNILTNMVEKLFTYTTMTFVWSEISFLALWYDKTHPSNRDKLKELIRSGRLEILTGGWVMTDEANVNLYAMVSQLIEGHQWMKNTLDEIPKHGWSIDPFGHGAAVPYLLKESGINETVIQRIHYNWKQWLAEMKYGDFLWRQTWDSRGDTDIMVHIHPYDLYSFKYTCGPHTDICLKYEFRKVPGEKSEYSIHTVKIDEGNIKFKAEELLEQYGRTGSLYPHNVVLIPLGDDFRYDRSIEWDQQYENYRKIIDFINSDASYNAHLQFGTLKDYFNEVYNRTKHFPSLQGDFFVYSDIYADGVPSYWSGYYTTRPYYKILGRQLEGVLHTTEVFYVAAIIKAAQNNFNEISQVLENYYEKLIKARQNLGLFQHHDAITGTAKSFVMRDYGLKLHESLHDSYSILGHAAKTLLATESTIQRFKNFFLSDHLQPTFTQHSYDMLPKPMTIDINIPQRLIVLTNSLAQRRYEMVKLLVLTSQIRLTDENGNNVDFQINPILNKEENGIVRIAAHFELFFIANLPPLSIITYTIHKSENVNNTDKICLIYSNFVRNNVASPFIIKNIISDDIHIENNRLNLKFDGGSGMLTSVKDKESGVITEMYQYYGSYPSARFRSGAYLFKPDIKNGGASDHVLTGSKVRILIKIGPISSEFTAMFGAVLIHSFRIFHVIHEPLASSIYMENSVDFGTQYNSSETPGFSSNFGNTELFFRFQTDINSGDNSIFYTDQNGLSMQRRVQIERIGIEGNYYPITSATYIQTESKVRKRKRFTILVDHAAGAASWEKGWIEVMIERRTLYDDSRGLSEAVTDQKRTLGRYWLLLENMNSFEDVPRLSLAANYLSNSLDIPSQVFVLEGLKPNTLKTAASLVNQPFPCSLHLLSLRVLSESQYPGLLPSNEALLTIHNQPPSCAVASVVSSCRGIANTVSWDTKLSLPIMSIDETSLTGVYMKGNLKNLSDFVVPKHRVRSAKLTFQTK